MTKERAGVDLIAAERDRQVSQEGWSAEHDDAHSGFEMTKAAVGYAQFNVFVHENGETPEDPPCDWPWDDKWWKPSDDPVRNLVKAGALIAAEIDRLQRQKARGK